MLKFYFSINTLAQSKFGVNYHILTFDRTNKNINDEKISIDSFINLYYFR